MSIKVIKWDVAATHSKSFQLLLISIKMIKWGVAVAMSYKTLELDIKVQYRYRQDRLYFLAA